MRVLIVSPYRTVVPHFENELEIAQRHLDQGDNVTFISCLGELPGCDFNATGDREACRECSLRRGHGLQMLNGRVRHRALDAYVEPGKLGSTPQAFFSVDQLKETKVGNFDIGYATLSSVVSQVRDPEPDLNKHRGLVETFHKAASMTSQAMVNALSREKPDLVYVFNGRFAAMRAVLRACQLAGVDCLVHERGCDTTRYQLFRNRLPHDIDYINRRMRRHWNRHVNDDDRERTARDWFYSRIRRVEKNWHSFVKQQQAGCLPADWDIDEHNLVLFTSSEDEFVAIGDCWSNRLYDDQTRAIRRIAIDLMESRPDARLTVRVHPNLIGIDNGSTRRLAALDLPNVRMIAAGEQIDSYQLMRVADTVVTFGSSIGIEAVFSGKPSVLLGPSFYKDLKGPRVAESHQHAIQLLSEDLMPAVDHEALIYGYWQNTNGIAFRYFQAEGLFDGTFKGQRIYPKPTKSMGDRVNAKWNSVKKRVLPKRKAA